MKRRAFLASLGAAFALDPERALWVPGAKTISVPAPRVTRSFIDACAAQQAAIDEYGYHWRRDEIVYVTTATPEEAARFAQFLFVTGAPS